MEEIILVQHKNTIYKVTVSDAISLEKEENKLKAFKSFAVFYAGDASDVEPDIVVWDENPASWGDLIGHAKEISE